MKHCSSQRRVAGSDQRLKLRDTVIIQSEPCRNTVILHARESGAWSDTCVEKMEALCTNKYPLIMPHDEVCACQSVFVQI